MSKITALDVNHHYALKVDVSKVVAESANAQTIPILLSEIIKASAEYPLVFVKNQQSGQFIPVVLCGFRHDENLYVSDGNWDASYTPFNVQRQPFFLGTENAEGVNKSSVLCLDLDSKCLGDVGHVLFDEKKMPSEYLTHMHTLLSQLYHGNPITGNFSKTLADYDLLEEITLDIKFDNGDVQSVKKTYTIDRQKLAEIDNKIFLDLRKQDYLMPVYAMIISLDQIQKLVNRRNIRDRKDEG